MFSKAMVEEAVSYFKSYVGALGPQLLNFSYR